VRNRIMGSFCEHQAIVDAILAGDGELAERQLRDHVLIQGERLTDFLATLDSAAVA
jgi:DNA-binding FadR family transcriptional regulator